MIEKWATEKIENPHTVPDRVFTHCLTASLNTTKRRRKKTHSNIDSESDGNDDDYDFVNDNARARAIQKTVQYTHEQRTYIA